MILAIKRRLHEWRRSPVIIWLNLARKIPIFFVVKHYVIEQNFAKIFVKACVNFRICRLLAIFPTVLSSSVDLFFMRRGPTNIMGAVAENPRFRYIKIVLSETVFNIPFQKTIERSYRAAMFVYI